ncbi:MAG: hypothetical protein C0507_23120 [Cyanobacteria bacterium PR.3.49]|nr:hypothetical protein [Cyanobacteria bacterium PR.3.49]
MSPEENASVESKTDRRDQEITRLVEGESLVIEPGTMILKKYKVLQLLGTGGMGSVYKAVDTESNTGMEYAIKFLNRQQKNDAAMRRFEIEARAANKLDHPNLIKVHESGLLPDGQPFFIMDLVEGDSLADLLSKHGRLSVDKATNIFIQVGFALSYAHSNGVVHRDIKPSNIMIQSVDDDKTLGSVVKVVDFGIAKLTGQDEFNQQTLTRTGEIFGSPLYMSPEQCLGTGVDHRSDLYSLGCVLYEALTGAPPLVGDTALSTMLKHQGETAVSLKEASMGIEFPAQLEIIVSRLLAKDVENRYQSAQQFTSDLVSFDCGQASMISAPEAKTIFIPRPQESMTFSREIKLLAAAVIFLCGVPIGYFIPRAETPAAPPQAGEQIPPVEPAKIEQTLTELANTPGYFSTFGPGRDERTFNFPEFSIGKISFVKNKSKVARGKVLSGPKFHGALFTPGAELRKHPELLDKFRADDLCGLNVSSPISLTSFIDVSLSVDSLILHSLRIKSLQSIDISDSKIRPETLRKLDTLPNLQNLWAARADISGKDLAQLQVLSRLEVLCTEHIRGFTPGIKKIAEGNSINYLSQNDSEFGLEQMRLLSKCGSMVSLDIQKNRGVTDECIAFAPANLENLTISGCPVTPKCIPALAKLKRLKNLHISLNGWSNEDLQKLRHALPKAELNP